MHTKSKSGSMWRIIVHIIWVLAPYFGILMVSFVGAIALKNQMIITSDTLYMFDLSRDLLDGGSISDWKLTPAPDFFPHMLVYVFLSIFTTDAYLQLFLITIFQIFSLGSVLFFLFREIGQSRYFGFLESVGLVALVCFYQLHSIEWIFLYKTNNHFSSITLGLVLVVLALRNYRVNFRGGRSYYVAIFCFNLLGTASTITFIYAVTIPIFLWSVLEFPRSNGSRIAFKSHQHWVWFVFSLISSSFFAFQSSLRSSSSSDLKARMRFFQFEFDVIQTLAMKTFTRLFVDSGLVVRSISLFALATLTLSLFSYFTLSLKFWRKLSNGALIAQLLQISCLSLLSSGFFTLISGGIVDEFSLRYFWPSILMLASFVVIVFVESFQLVKKSVFSKMPLGFIIVFLTIVSLFNSAQPENRQVTSVQSVAKCITGLKEKGVNLEQGVTDYWYGRSVNYFIPNSKRNYVAVNSLQPFFWMTSRSYYTEPANYNWILLHTTPDAFNFNVNAMAGLLTTPSEIFKCQGTDLEIYYYSDNSLGKIIQESLRLWRASVGIR